MIKKISHNFVGGTIHIPSSKSYFQRAIVTAALADRPTVIKAHGISQDGLFLLEALRSIGVETTPTEGDQIKIIPPPNGFKDQATVNVGESGLGSRLIIPVLAAIGGVFTIEGEGSLLKRPFEPVIEILESAGITVRSNQGKLPITIEGKLQGDTFEIPADTSSQFASGFMMALPLLGNDIKIQLRNPRSIPYINMTLQVLHDFGIDYQETNPFKWILPKQSTYTSPVYYKVEADWSAAAFWIVAGIAYNKVQLKGLDKASLQADRAIMELLDQISADYQWEEDELTVQKSNLVPFIFDATHCPDLFPSLAVLAALTEGVSCIKGVSRLTHKESDRGKVIQLEWAKVGIEVSLEKEEMRIDGGGIIKGTALLAHNDHRIAMALAVLSCSAQGESQIQDASCVSKSYPDFWNDFETMSVNL